TASDLLKDNFYHFAEKTEDGPVVVAGLNYAKRTGYYATSSAVFIPHGFTHNVSTGISGSFDVISYAVSYDAVQYSYNSLYNFSNNLNVMGQFNIFHFSYRLAEAYQSTEISLDKYIGRLFVGASLSQDSWFGHEGELAHNSEAKMRFRFSNVSYSLRFLEINARLNSQHHFSYNVNQNLSINYFRIPRLASDRQEINIEFRSDDYKLSYKLNKIEKLGLPKHLVNTVVIERSFQELSFEMLLNDAETNFTGSAILLKYYKYLN
ncbi:MAG: hypothetical protein OEZ58_18370, partial [Gammaproteobacteria bacterium]|nr:hypothetical protein [Gammaproteobacteria bacterium]